MSSQAAPPQTLWDEPHIKALLRLRRFPLRLIQVEPWQSWLVQRGGPKAVLEKLLAYDLSANQHDLLEVILRNPEASPEFYAFQLNLSPSTYFVHLRALVDCLAHHLNHEPVVSPDAVTVQRRHCDVPILLTSVIGIEYAVSQVMELLCGQARLVTIIGPGGIGKTRLAIQIAGEFLSSTTAFRDGVVFVSLAVVSQIDQVASLIAQALGVESSNKQPVGELLCNDLSQQDLLLVLDNFEHVTEAARLVNELLIAAPTLKVLVTSREVLHVYGEYQFSLPPLSLPPLDPFPALDVASGYSAVRLFLERAQMVRPDFALTPENVPAVAEICAHLDGLPLAIELAAARIKLLSPQQIVKQFDSHFAFLGNDSLNVDARHQTLWKTLEWSYVLLDETEKMIFRRLGVFTHYWTLEAAQQVCEFPHLLSTLAALVDKSLIQLSLRAEDANNPGFCMLQTIRQYALVQLDACGELAATKQRHLDYYLHFLRDAEASMGSPDENIWLERVRAEIDNVRAAFSWALETEPVQALDLVARVWCFWGMLSLLSEGRRWIEEALTKAPVEVNPNRVDALFGAGWLAAAQGDFSQAETYFDLGLKFARQLEIPGAIGGLLHGVAEIAMHQEEFERAEALLEESRLIYIELGDRVQIAWSLDLLGRVSLARKDYARAALRLEQALLHFRQVGHPWGIAWALDHLGQVMRAQGDYRRSQDLLEESRVHLRSFDNTWRQAWTLTTLGGVRLQQGDLDGALSLFRESLKMHTQVKNTAGTVATLDEMIALAVARQDDRHAMQLAAAVQFNAALIGYVRPVYQPPIECVLAEARSRLGNDASAEAWWAGQAMSLNEAIALGREILG